jgi:hypothetical protein
MKVYADNPAEAELLAEVATVMPGLGRLLPAVARPGPTGVSGDGLDQLQVFDAVRALLMRRSEQSPVVVVLGICTGLTAPAVTWSPSWPAPSGWVG